ncbi:MAG: hypothetical protein ETSY2_46410 [Candidatus Entotheonella gemina]|uniref:Uncharacterized protein n=1 Tax=Candidatus Entotheonella gemina TaxID=1429439 RepID=W4LEB1_9BACT|nr:MAG: hypothetical protein ETSY2_46410 [Candidatus Entotheonella gemina]
MFKVKAFMQGVFGYVPLVDVNVRPIGYASPYAILPRFPTLCFQRLMFQGLTLRQLMNHANLEPKGVVF